MKSLDILSLVLLLAAFVVVAAVSEGCGQRKALAGTVFGGARIRKGQWPWIVAFLHRFERNFFCGGSLISDKHVLSGEILQIMFGYLCFMSQY